MNIKIRKVKGEINKVKKNSLIYGITIGNKRMKKAFYSTIDVCIESMFKLINESSFHYGDKDTMMETAEKILRVIGKRSLEYTKETRQDYVNDVTNKSAKVMEVIEIYTELVTRGYEPEEAVVEIAEKITFNLKDKEVKDYNLNKYKKRKSG